MCWYTQHNTTQNYNTTINTTITNCTTINTTINKIETMKQKQYVIVLVVMMLFLVIAFSDQCTITVRDGQAECSGTCTGENPPVCKRVKIQGTKGDEIACPCGGRKGLEGCVPKYTQSTDTLSCTRCSNALCTFTAPRQGFCTCT